MPPFSSKQAVFLAVAPAAKRPLSNGRWGGFILLVLLWVTAGCSSAIPSSPSPAASPTVGITLTPYASPTPGPVISVTPGKPISPTPLPSATPTPFFYKIVEGDTLIAIAFRFGVDTETLLAANPGIDPRFLVIGDELMIPLVQQDEGLGQQPTPVDAAVPASEPVCYAETDKGVWCFLLVENRGSLPLENLAASILLYDGSLELLDTRTAYGSVNILPPGERLPLMAWFPPPAGEIFQAAARLESAFPVPPGDARYLETALDYQVELSERLAVVRGEVTLLGEQAAGVIWIGLTAFDEIGQVVAVRRYALEEEKPSGASQPFEVELYSLGNEIQSVEVLVEARP